MQRYIEQLIEDIRLAASQAPAGIFDDEEIDDEEALERELEEAEKFVSGPFEKLSDIVGIPRSLLPAPERLNQDQTKILVPEMIKLLNAYNFIPEYPEKVPTGMLYKALCNIWEDEYVYLTTGQSHIEFCDYDEDECPFPGFCDYCKENSFEEDYIPPNEFNVNANDLSADETKIDDDFRQIEKEYYHHSEITDDEGFVPGIHNYCDRWCERCDFTDKCRVFAMEEELKSMLDEKNKGREPDEKPAEQSFEEDDFEDEDDTAPPFELEFEDELDDLNLGEDDFFSPQKKADRHPMIGMAYQYSMNTLKWFRMRWSKLEKSFTAQLAKGYADELMNAEEVMQWYHMFIYVKLKRALSGYYEMEEFEDADYDMNGSAKVALIGIDRSIEAATTLLRHLKEHREEIRAFRDQLERIRIMAEELFPDARSFVRPGLDEL